MHTKKDEGFTLVELLIVIVILGILATVTVFAVRGITDTAQENTCRTEVATVQSAVEAYFVRNGQTYPTDLSDLWTGDAEYLRGEPSYLMTVTADGEVTASLDDNDNCQPWDDGE